MLFFVQLQSIIKVIIYFYYKMSLARETIFADYGAFIGGSFGALAGICASAKAISGVALSLGFKTVAASMLAIGGTPLVMAGSAIFIPLSTIVIGKGVFRLINTANLKDLEYPSTILAVSLSTKIAASDGFGSLCMAAGKAYLAAAGGATLGRVLGRALGSSIDKVQKPRLSMG
jgi:hypothetical protein